MNRFLFLLLPVMLSAAPGRAVNFSSGPSPVALIELYTSEGCSSCPPAERWLNGLRDDPRLWREFVPVAFHVNYWDNLGWKDKFASKAFTDRQRAIARSWSRGQVYTPCFVRNGAEWRTRDLAMKETRETGVLTAALGGGNVRVRYQPEAGASGIDFEVFVAVLGSGFVSQVKAGENAGRKLAHEFVALALQSTPLALDANAGWSGEIKLAPAESADTSRRALAIWVTRRGDLVPIQATGGWLE